jgi:hypothetical protein
MVIQVIYIQHLYSFPNKYKSYTIIPADLY